MGTGWGMEREVRENEEGGWGVEREVGEGMD